MEREMGTTDKDGQKKIAKGSLIFDSLYQAAAAEKYVWKMLVDHNKFDKKLI